MRRNTNPAWLQNGPVTDLASKDLRCNLGGGISNGTETVSINPAVLLLSIPTRQCITLARHRCEFSREAQVIR
jgi:hypothetical protein